MFEKREPIGYTISHAGNIAFVIILNNFWKTLERRKGMQVTISDSIKYIGVDDREIDLFESQYVVPDGVTYNSYLIVDEKTALMETVDAMSHIHI